jgi:hypothetical protein
MNQVKPWLMSKLLLLEDLKSILNLFLKALMQLLKMDLLLLPWGQTPRRSNHRRSCDLMLYCCCLELLSKHESRLGPSIDSSSGRLGPILFLSWSHGLLKRYLFWSFSSRGHLTLPKREQRLSRLRRMRDCKLPLHVFTFLNVL